MQLRAIIIDDEQNGINALKILIDKYISNVKVVANTTKATQGIELIENYKPEIVFLDINMPEMDGFQLLQKLNWKKFDLIFTTAHEEYALKAIKANAIDYLLKPIDFRELQQAIKKLTSRIEEKDSIPNGLNLYKLAESFHNFNRKKIKITSRSGIENIYASDIIYLESLSNEITIYLSDSRTVSTTKSLKEFEILLCETDNNFIRVHNSYLVNCQKVVRYKKGEELIVMANNHEIPIAKSRKDDFLKWLKSINGIL